MKKIPFLLFLLLLLFFHQVVITGEDISIEDNIDNKYEIYCNEAHSYQIKFPHTWMLNENSVINDEEKSSIVIENPNCSLEFMGVGLIKLIESSFSYQEALDFFSNSFLQKSTEVISERDIKISKRMIREVVVKEYDNPKVYNYLFYEEGYAVGIFICPSNDNFPFENIIESFQFVN